MAVNTKGQTNIRDISGNKRFVVIGVAAVLILIALYSLLAQIGLVGGPDVQAGYYVIQVTPPADATPDQLNADGVFGFERLALNGDGSYRLGFLNGNWSRSGSSVTMTPSSAPPADQFYSKTSMAKALSVMLKPVDFSISSDGKTLTGKTPNGPLVFQKVNEVMR